MRPLKGELSCAVLTWMPWERGEFTDLCTESFPYSYYHDSLLCPWMSWIPSPWSAWSSLDQLPSQWDAGPDRTWRKGHMAPQTKRMLPVQLQTAVSALSECQSWAAAPANSHFTSAGKLCKLLSVPHTLVVLTRTQNHIPCRASHKTSKFPGWGKSHVHDCADCFLMYTMNMIKLYFYVLILSMF